MDPNIQQAPIQTVSSSNTPLAPMPEPPKSHNWIKWVLMIFVIAILSSGGTYILLKSQSQKQTPAAQAIQTPPAATPTTDQTANWKTYVDAKLGYSLKYPPTYTKIDEGDTFAIISPLNPDHKGNDIFDGEMKIEVIVQPSKGADSLEKLASDYSIDPSVLKQPRVLISGVNALRITYQEAGSGETLYLITNGRRYQINKFPLQTSRQQEFDQILSTLKFTDQNDILKETNGFPIYPNAIFLKKEQQASCGLEKTSGFSMCNSTTYTWETNDDFDTVNPWYMQDKSNSGWKCSGSAGSYNGSRDSSSKTTCINGVLSYDLYLSANKTKTTITLSILNK